MEAFISSMIASGPEAKRPPHIWFEDFVPGTVLRSAPRAITLADIDRYAELTGERHPVHMDEDFARAAGFRGRIAHGLFGLPLIEGLKARGFVFRTLRQHPQYAPWIAQQRA